MGNMVSALGTLLYQKKTDHLFVRQMSLFGLSTPVKLSCMSNNSLINTCYTVPMTIQSICFMNHFKHYLVEASSTCPASGQLSPPAYLHLTAGYDNMPALFDSFFLLLLFSFVLRAISTGLPSFSGGTLIKSSMLNPVTKIKDMFQMTEKFLSYLPTMFQVSQLELLLTKGKSSRFAQQLYGLTLGGLTIQLLGVLPQSEVHLQRQEQAQSPPKGYPR